VKFFVYYVYVFLPFTPTEGWKKRLDCPEFYQALLNSSSHDIVRNLHIISTFTLFYCD